jgi:hypothetical protein
VLSVTHDAVLGLLALGAEWVVDGADAVERDDLERTAVERGAPCPHAESTSAPASISAAGPATGPPCR